VNALAYRKREKAHGPGGPRGPKSPSALITITSGVQVFGQDVDLVHVLPWTSLFVSTSLDTWTAGQPIIFTRGVQIDDTAYLALISKLRVAPLANGLGETRRLRGDGSARSQQTRLGSALGSHRDRSFDGLRIVRASAASKHKGVAMYSLEPVEPSAGWGPWGPCGDLDEEGPHESSGDNSTDYGLFGDLGDLEGVPPRVERNFCVNAAEDVSEDTRAHACGEASDKVPKVPKVPKMSASDCSESQNGMGTLDGKVPTRSPSSREVPKSPTRTRIDLADFTEWPEPPNGRQS